jgi:GWxTD domain-containing protein
MLPAERRNLAEVDSAAEAVNFVETFWALRDPDPSSPDNSFRQNFSSRVEAADLLYPEGGLRGALTARGRALILLGPWARLEVSSEPALKWTTGRRANRRVTTRKVDVEIWRYPPETLPPRYEAALRAKGHDEGVELRFHLTAAGARLVEGESFLEMAAKVALVKD